MPELAEVVWFSKQWTPGIHKRISEVRVHPKARIFRDIDAEKLVRHLTGKRLRSIHTYAKRMGFAFSDSTWLDLHLGMSGKLLTGAPEMIPDRHEHLVLYTGKRGPALVFSDYRMFGKVDVRTCSDSAEAWSGLPPEPHADAFTRRYFDRLLQRFARRPLKALLLEQAAFPGVGNWMADEILWRARIHPESKAHELTPAEKSRLYRISRAVCRDALRVIGTDWSRPPDSWLFNHRWKRDGICPKSRQPLEWITVGGRTSCFSPVLQKVPGNR
jgi:formamidopyrimidine-DNA glycosylase